MDTTTAAALIEEAAKRSGLMWVRAHGSPEPARPDYAAAVPIPLPDAQTRWRCTSCGNLTRFDVRRATRAREFVHVDLAGVQSVQERELLDDVAEHVTCRWCNNIDSIELVARPDAPEVAQAPGGAAPAGS